MSSATKKFALATLSAPVLAALAIGLAGSAAATPAGLQPSDTGTTTTADPDRISVPIKIFIRFKASPASGTTDQQPTSETARTPKRTTRGAATRAPSYRIEQGKVT